VTDAAVSEPALATTPAEAPGDMVIIDADRPGDDTTTRLVHAAAAVFAEKGYAGAGVAEIARRAGLTTGAIYSRYSGKAELLAAAISACIPDEFDQLFAEHAFDGRAKDILHTVGAHLVTREKSPMQGVLLEAFVAARRDPEVAAVLRTQFDDRRRRLADLIDVGKANGLIDPDLDTHSIVHFAHAVGLGFLAYEAIGATHPEAEPWETVISRVVTALDPPDLEPLDLESPAPTNDLTVPSNQESRNG
jgi:AcrR family transcriptional regulator